MNARARARAATCSAALILLAALWAGSSAGPSEVRAAGSGGATPGGENAGDPVDVFAALDGRWSGTFVSWSEDGREQLRISVEQEYETVDAHTQTVRVRDVMEDGTVVTGEGENTARRRADGSLALRCEVRKSNGEVSRHEGRLGTGPRGEKVLFWYSLGDERRETFREWVEGEGADALYRIQGVGRYGSATYVMAGDYARPRPDGGGSEAGGR